MNHKVKELFNSIYSKEEKAKSLEERKQANLKRNLRGIRLGAFRKKYTPVPSINDFTHFIDCEVSPSICPMRWDDLEIDFNSIDKRYCKYCDKFVYKVDNEFMLHKIQEENKCMAIANDLFEKMNGEFDEAERINLENRLAISKLFLVYKHNNKEKFEKFSLNEVGQEFMLKAIILDILDADNIEKAIADYTVNGVDLEIILHKVLSNMDDTKFKKQVNEKIIKLIKRSI